MTSQPVAHIHLDNGLTMEILDESRRVAGDRWQVRLLARIDIPVRANWFSGAAAAPAAEDELTQVLGESVRFEYRDERQFVDQAGKDRLFETLAAGVRANANRYYGHPDFGGRFIAKRYHEKTRQRVIRPGFPGT
jgi:hypothetical protein